MTDQCFEMEDVAEILTLSDDDPRRRHAEECPRCDAVLMSFSAFLDADAGSDPADAEARLAAFLDTNIKDASADAPKTIPGREGFFDVVAAVDAGATGAAKHVDGRRRTTA
jgi:hypothetical protein